MLDVKRIRHMTHMAMLEKRGLRSSMRMQQYTRKDYVSLRMLLGFIAGTILYAIAFAVVVTVVIVYVVGNVTYASLVTIAVVGVVAYLLYTYVHLKMVRRRAMHRYSEGMREVSEARRNLSILQQMYKDEEDPT